MNDTVRMILETMGGVKRPQAKFLIELLSVMMCFVGRATYRNLSRYSTYDEKTFSRWSRREVEFATMNKELLQAEFSEEGRVMLGVVDASFLPKSGKHTEGLGKFWNGSVGKAEKGLEVSVVGVVDLKSYTCYTLEAQQTVPKGGESRAGLYSRQLQEQSERLHALGVTHVVGDGYYSKREFVQAVRGKKFHMVGKLRCDADLYVPYTGAYQGRGRPRKYGKKVDLKGEHPLAEFTLVEVKEDGTTVHVAELYSKNFQQVIQAVVIRKGDAQALLYSTDLTLATMTVVEYYQARFQIEFVFRDAKQHTGLLDCQARTTVQITNHLNASLMALNLLKREDRRTKGVDEQTVISIDSWKRRKANQLLLTTVFQKLDLDQNSPKISKLLKELEDFGVIAA